MLKQRVVTALVLLAVLLPVLWAPVELPFQLFVLLAIALAAWEWSRLNGLQGAAAVWFGVELFVVLAFLVWAAPVLPTLFWLLTLGFWVLGGAWLMRGAAPAWAQRDRGLRLVIGMLVLLPAGLALLAWKQAGLNALLSVLCLVWMADIAAYFGGRAFGRRKLAPSISPGKSWEGVWSGLLGVLLLAWFWSSWVDVQSWVDGPSVYSRLIDGLGWPLAAAALLLLTALSVVGDLVESLIKRAAGAKDSSRLLPGHGGVLDRIDALLPVLPAALALTGISL
ncbi:MAG: phosphatidate cytidylyltransferase [Inhella sp.]